MGYVRDVKNAIYDALDDYDVDIYYISRSGDRCGYFTVTINEEYDRDDIEDAIDDVCDEYDLWIDDDSDGDFDLCEKYI